MHNNQGFFGLKIFEKITKQLVSFLKAFPVSFGELSNFVKTSALAEGPQGTFLLQLGKMSLAKCAIGFC